MLITAVRRVRTAHHSVVAWCATRTLYFFGATALALCTLQGVAQTYPTKPIRMVMGFTAGGGVDVMARLFTPKMMETLEIGRAHV